MYRFWILDYVVFIFGVIFMVFLVVFVFMISIYDVIIIYKDGIQFLFGGKMVENYEIVFFWVGGFIKKVDGLVMFKNLFIFGLGFVIGKIVILMIVVYVIVYFCFFMVFLCFWVIFVMLLLFLEVCILLFYEIV